jgi:GT2 family glycosyltransferase
MSQPDVTVTAIVVSYDSAAVLPACLGSLAAEQVASILVDNASSDESVVIGESLGARIVRNKRNEGFGRAMNIGMREAKTPFVLLMNPDLTLDPGAATRLMEAAQKYPDAAILAPRIVEPDGRIFFANRSLLAPYLQNPTGVKWSPEGDCCAPFLLGACWLVRRDLILAIGGFDPQIFLFYEDDDLCRRVIQTGHSIVHVHGAVARHERGASSARAPGRIFKARFHLAWSRLYMQKKWGLSEASWRWALLAAFKWIGAALVFNRQRRERYSGTVAGFLAHHRGKRALSHEGLEP